MPSLQTHASKILCLPIRTELMLFSFSKLNSQPKSSLCCFSNEEEAEDKFKYFWYSSTVHRSLELFPASLQYTLTNLNKILASRDTSTHACLILSRDA